MAPVYSRKANDERHFGATPTAGCLLRLPGFIFCRETLRVHRGDDREGDGHGEKYPNAPLIRRCTQPKHNCEFTTLRGSTSSLLDLRLQSLDDFSPTL